MSFVDLGKKYKFLIDGGIDSNPSIYSIIVDFESETHVGGIDIRGTKRLFRKDLILKINEIKGVGVDGLAF